MPELPARPTLLYRSHGALVILVHANVAPGVDDWNAYLDFLKTAFAHPRSALLVITGKAPPPSAVQREGLTHVTPKRVRTAVVTESQISRGVVTLLGWFHENIAAFAPEKIGRAFDFLDVPQAERTLVTQTVLAMQRELAGGDPAQSGASPALQKSAIDSMNDAVARMSSTRNKR